MGEWISVKDRLPEKCTMALVYGHLAGGGLITTLAVCHYIKKGEWLAVPSRSMTVTHWMPLPDPPKEGSGK